MPTSNIWRRPVSVMRLSTGGKFVGQTYESFGMNSRTPPSRIEMTITTATTTAQTALKSAVFVPQALAWHSSNVTSKRRLYERSQHTTTPSDSPAQSQRSLSVSVRMDTDPKSVVQTSPETLDVDGLRFISR